MKMTGVLLLAAGLVSPTLAQEGDIPRTPWGTPDLNGVWERPYVPDMSQDRENGTQIGAGPLPFTAAGRENFENYDAAEGDYTGICLPFGQMRAMNSPDPIQFMQTETHLAFLYEQNTWFKVVNLDGEDHYTGIPTWYGHSIANWKGDTLEIVTNHFNGKTRLDTIGHPHSHLLTMTERFTLVSEDTMEYEVIIDDPIYYTEPFSNRRTFTRVRDFELFEYSCMENNKSMFEGRIEPPDYENWHTYDLDDYPEIDY